MPLKHPTINPAPAEKLVHLVLLSVFFHHSKKHWVYLLLVFFALIAAGAGLSSVLVINQAAVASLETAAITPAYRITAKPGSEITLQHYGELRRMGLVDAIAVAETQATINGQEVTFYGVDALALLNNRLRASVQTPTAVNPMITSMVMSEQTAKVIGVDSGLKLTLANGKTTPPVLVQNTPFDGLVDNTNNNVFLPLTTFLQLFNGDETTPLQAVFLLAERHQTEFNQLASQLPSNLVMQWVVKPNDSSTMGKSFSFHLMAMGGLLTVVSLFIVTNALSMLFAHRHQTIASLHKIGISKRSIAVTLCLELAIYCVLGSLLGVLLGLWAVTQFDTGLTTTLANLLRAPFTLTTVSFSSVAVLCLGLCCVGMVFAVVAPLRQALRIDSANSPRLMPKGVVVAAAVLSLVVVVALLQFKTKGADLCALALLILSSSLGVSALLPSALHWLATKISRAYPLLHWSLASAQQLAGRCQLAASSYFIALACAIGLSGMVDSFRQATDSWLTQRLAAQAYVYSSDSSLIPSSASMFVQTRHAARGTLNGEAITVSDYPVSSSNDAPTAQAIPANIQQIYQNAMLFSEQLVNVWPLFGRGEAVLVNQQFAFRHNIRVGEQATLRLGSRQQVMTVAGIYYDYGNPLAAGLVAPQFMAGSGTLESVAALHVLSQAVDWAQYEQQLLSVLPDATLISKAKLLAVSLQIFDRTFILVDGLTLVALIIAALSFAITIALLSRHLRGHIQILSALGLRFSAIRWAVFFQFALICLLVTLLAIPAGLMFSYLLITTVNVNAFGWTYPLNLSLLNISLIALSGFGGVLLACGLAVTRATGRQLPKGFTTAVLMVAVSLAGCSPKQNNQPLFGPLAPSTAQQPPEFKYQLVDTQAAIQLPVDHAPHSGFQLEWWYLTSVLQDAQQRFYPFQYTLFRFNLAGTQTYMAHASLHTPDKHWFEQRFAEQGLPYISTVTDPFTLSLDDWLWQGSGQGEPFPAHLNIQFWQGPNITLQASANGPYVLHGEQGVSKKSANGNHLSYYYSQPFLQASAQIKHGEETINLTGPAWYDHEWTSQLVQDNVEGWDWFSLHLDNGTKIMVFRLRIGGQPDYITGTYIQANGSAKTLNAADFILQPAEKEGIPLQWQLQIPSHQLSLTLKPMKQDQWNCGLFNYYEGGITVSGSVGGVGFMELTGYPPPQSACD